MIRYNNLLNFFSKNIFAPYDDWSCGLLNLLNCFDCVSAFYYINDVIKFPACLMTYPDCFKEWIKHVISTIN